MNNWRLIKVQYVKKHNACKETRIKSNLTADQAIDNLNSYNIPAYIYCDGTQNLDSYFKFFWLSNDEYKKEMNKISDI